ncbi:MAG: hypothetical protein R2839_07065 [Thermomicrobiales bacterium]
MSAVRRIDHVAIAVRSLEESKPLFESIYGARFLGQRENAEQEYIVAYFLMGESLITMLQGTTPEEFRYPACRKAG